MKIEEISRENAGAGPFEYLFIYKEFQHIVQRQWKSLTFYLLTNTLENVLIICSSQSQYIYQDSELLQVS